MTLITRWKACQPNSLQTHPSSEGSWVYIRTLFSRTVPYLLVIGLKNAISISDNAASTEGMRNKYGSRNNAEI
jgi:hypothetical protein